jgi:hypothetical protein
MKGGKLLHFPVRNQPLEARIPVQDGTSARYLLCEHEAAYSGAMMPAELSQPRPLSWKATVEQYLHTWKQTNTLLSSIDFDFFLAPVHAYHLDLDDEVVEFVEGPAPSLFVGEFSQSMDEAADWPTLILSDSDLDYL